MYKKLHFTLNDGEEMTNHYYSTSNNEVDIKKILKNGFIECKGIYIPLHNIRHMEIEKNVGRDNK